MSGIIPWRILLEVMGRIRHLYHLIFCYQGRKMTIPTTGKGLMLERMTRILQGKVAAYMPPMPFSQPRHVLVEIPEFRDFQQDREQGERRHGNGIPENPGICRLLRLGCRISTRSACRSATFTGSDGTSRSSIQSIRRSRSREEYGQLLEENGSPIKRPCRHPPRYIFPRIPTKNGIK